MEQEMSRRTLRLPQDVSEFVRETAFRRRTSMNEEIVTALRERMAATGEGLVNQAPAAARDTSARQGADIHQRPCQPSS